MKVALSQVMQYRSFVQMSQIGHIFDFLEFWWIDWREEFSFHIFFLLNEDVNDNEFNVLWSD